MPRRLVPFVGTVTIALSLATAVRLDAQATAPSAPLPKVYVFATGGTISNRQGGRLTVEELIKAVPGIDQRARVDGEQFANVSSGQITMDQWLDLARRVDRKFKEDADLAGIVVTSGTD